MVRSPKSGRELKSARSYKGPKWLADAVSSDGEKESDDSSDSG